VCVCVCDGKGGRGRTVKQRGRVVSKVVKKSSKATVHTPSLIRRPLNPGVKY
jgi:hypothetical protein